MEVIDIDDDEDPEGEPDHREDPSLKNFQTQNADKEMSLAEMVAAVDALSELEASKIRVDSAKKELNNLVAKRDSVRREKSEAAGRKERALALLQKAEMLAVKYRRLALESPDNDQCKRDCSEAESSVAQVTTTVKLKVADCRVLELQEMELSMQMESVEHLLVKAEEVMRSLEARHRHLMEST